MAKRIEINYIKDFRLCDKAHFLIMKGIAILLVLIAYVTYAYLGMEQLAPLAGVGSTIFLFCSGFGVSESFMLKQGVPHYWENKIVKVWIPSIVALWLFSAILYGNGLAWISSAPIGLDGWFLYMLFAYYLLFWVVVQYLENKNTQVTVLFAAAAIAFFAVEKRTCAEALLAFPLGVLFSQYGLKRKVREFGWKGISLFCAALLILAVGGYMLTGICSHYLLVNLCCLISKTSTALLLIFGVFFLRKIPVFGIFAPLGTISYGIYLIMPYILPSFMAQGDWQRLLKGLALMILVSAVYSWLFGMLHQWNKRTRRKRSPKLKGSM